MKKMYKQQNYDCSGFREPTRYEFERVSKFFQELGKKKIRFLRRFSIVSEVVGVLFLLMFVIIFPIKGEFFSFVAAIICIATAFHYNNNQKHCIDMMVAFNTGEFIVMDVTVLKLETEPDGAGLLNVWLASNDGKREFKPHYVVRMEDVSVGSQLLLVYPKSDYLKKDCCKAFTSFMLTDEGTNLYV